MLTRAAFVSLLLWSVAGSAQTHSPTIQQAFDQATIAYEAHKWPEALAAYTELERRLTKPGRSLAITRVRKGIVLGQLGRYAEAQRVLLDGFGLLPADDPSLTLDRYEGHLALGHADEVLHQPSAALEAYAFAQRVAPDADAKISAVIGQARINTYLDPAQALSFVNQAIALSNVDKGRDKRYTGQLYTLRGRALLNLGNFKEAQLDLEKAIGLLGGLTTRVSASDLAARSDVAIATLLAGDSASAKKYLAYAGSGTLDDGFQRGANMELPSCGEATGLRPDDVAVIEFSIADDGTVGSATPVYVSRPGLPMVEFARAVSGWSWAPAPLAKIPPLLRSLTRVELRCSLASDRPTIQANFDAAVRAWFRSQHFTSTDLSGNAASDLVAIREGLRKGRAAGTKPIELAPWLFELDRNHAAPQSERTEASVAWATAVRSASPPPMVLAAAELALTDATFKPTPYRSRERTMKVIAASLPIISEPAIANDYHSANAVRLRLADDYLQFREQAAAGPLVQAVIADGRLPADDALRSAALIRASGMALAAGDLPAARSAYEQSGLSDTQCSLVDAAPAVTHRAGGVADFPPEAIAWGISGWSNTEFDIKADGTTTNVRATIAYPPFVFAKPTVKIFERTRYTQSYRPGGVSGCTGFHATQGFRVERR